MKYILLFLILISSRLYAQDFQIRVTPFIPGKIILKDSTVRSGEIKMMSVFKPRLKEADMNSSKKVNYKEIDKIITNPGTEKERTFVYRVTTTNKWVKFLELITEGDISIFAEASVPLNQFYSDYDRSTIEEIFNRERAKEYQFSTTSNHYTSNYYYYTRNIGSYTNYFYLKIKNNPILVHTKQVKNLKRNSSEIFDHCVEFKKEILDEKVNLNDLLEFTQRYSEICGKKSD